LARVQVKANSLRKNLTIEEPFKTHTKEARFGISNHEDGTRTGRRVAIIVTVEEREKRNVSELGT
jgi:hypothetical protein